MNKLGILKSNHSKIILISKRNAGSITSESGKKAVDYVPGTAASIQGEVGPEGGWVVVSWVPVSCTSVDLAASHPESSTILPISAISENSKL